MIAYIKTQENDTLRFYKDDLFIVISSVLDYNTCFLCHFHVFSF